MTKPIGYYVSDSKDIEMLDEIRAAWGDRLEELDRGQKLHLLHRVAELLYESQPLDSIEIPQLFDRQLDLLSDSALLTLAIAVVGQLRDGK